MTADIKPIHYRLVLEPDLDRFVFSGTAEIRLHAGAAVGRIALDMKELAVRSCEFFLDGTFVPCPFSIHPAEETLRVLLPGEISGEIALRILYEGRITDDLAGFYRSRYELEGREKYMGVTQFEESDARRAFPCMDHPAMKATFDVELITDASLTGISNGSLLEETSAGGGRKRLRFERTPRMSTYLLFFGVGDFRFLHHPEDRRVRLAALPGQIPRGGYGLDFGMKSLRFCEAYFAIPYPLSKIDLISVPDFAFGAMENWGAVTFRENLLLHFPGITSSSGEERICEVVAHEIVHQWFGNLVTPSDWRYLWLNESFATFFGYGIVDHFHPEWQVWHPFLLNQTDAALDRDALHETLAIELPEGGHAAIDPSTAPIIYNKGGSVLRQVKGYIGDEAFRAGLRVYLSAHSYDCASSSQLWESLESVSGRPVMRLMKGWIEQPGHPVVKGRRKNGRLILTQRRFTYLPNDSDQVWPVPVSVRVFYRGGGSKVISMLLSESSGTLELGGDVVAYKVNAGQDGFYRVKYEEKADLEELGRRVRQKTLGPEDRWGLQNDLFALAKTGEQSLEEYLDFISWYEEETDYLPLAGIASNLHSAFLTVGPQTAKRVASAGNALFEKGLRAIGLEHRQGDAHLLSILRDQLLMNAARYGSLLVESFAMEKVSALRSGSTVHPDIMKSVLQIGAMGGDAGYFHWLAQRLAASESEHERNNILLSMGCFRNQTVLEEVRGYILEQVPDRNKFIPIAAMCGNREAVSRMWPWYVTHVGELERFHPIHYARVIASIVPMGGLGNEPEVRSFFDAYAERQKGLRGVIRLALEKLEINRRLRERYP